MLAITFMECSFMSWSLSVVEMDSWKYKSFKWYFPWSKLTKTQDVCVINVLELLSCWTQKNMSAYCVTGASVKLLSNMSYPEVSSLSAS